MIITIAVIVALFFAMNIGGSGAAASMGIAYGSGVIKQKRTALYICACGIFLGAAFGSEAVINTIGSELIATSSLSLTFVMIILGSACISLFIANIIGIPLSTSEVTVGAIIGVGFIYNTVYIDKLISIVIWWIITPFAAFIIVYITISIFTFVKDKWRIKLKINPTVIASLVIFAGFLEALSAGMNNVANAVGPLVGANIISMPVAMILGGVFIALGAIFLGGKVLETNGKKITKLSLQDGIIVSFTGALIAIIASLFGIPVPMTQITTSGIISAGFAQHGTTIFHKNIFKKIMIIWVVSPVLAFSISYIAVQVIVEQNRFITLVSCLLLLITISLIFLKYCIKQNKLKRRRV